MIKTVGSVLTFTVAAYSQAVRKGSPTTSTASPNSVDTNVAPTSASSITTALCTVSTEKYTPASTPIPSAICDNRARCSVSVNRYTVSAHTISAVDTAMIGNTGRNSPTTCETMAQGFRSGAARHST